MRSGACVEDDENTAASMATGEIGKLAKFDFAGVARRTSSFAF
jgi:hypothetical protein